MAVFTDKEFSPILKYCARGDNPSWTKDQLKAAVQAVEDRFESSRNIISNDIDAASAPFVFDNAQKKKIVKYWLMQKFGIE